MIEIDRNGLEVLGEAECLELLAQTHVGRVAVHSQALPAIFPVNYLLTDDGIVFRTSRGSKLAAATQHAVVAFEIDESDARYHEGWSVVAVGIATEITAEDDLARARQLPLRAWGSTAADHYVRIGLDRVTGRRVGAE